MESNSINHEHGRTIAIVKELAKGRRLTLDEDGNKVLAMGEDMTIGFLAHKETDEGLEKIVLPPLDGPIDLAGLNKLLNEYDVSFPIPSGY